MPIRLTLEFDTAAALADFFRNLAMPCSPDVPAVTKDDLHQLEDKIMSQLSDAIAAANTSADRAIDRVQQDVTSLQARIDALQAQVDAGGATQADMDAIAALQAKLDALDPTKEETLPTT